LFCLGPSQRKKIQFLNNIDPDLIATQTKEWNPADTFFFIVSKSGGTAETMAALIIITQWLKSNQITAGNWKEYIVLCTDPHKGDLRQLAKEFQLPSLQVPSSIGGRYSVLSDVGLFTAAWIGIDVDRLIKGAEAIKPKLLDSDPELNLLTQATCWLASQLRAGMNQTVLMPYSSLLKSFTAWWVQLWAESLGKKGKGLTPIMAYGATDQHSQMQLFMEGPKDKAMIFISIENFQNKISLKNDFNLMSLKLLAPFSLNQLIQAEFEGTLKALSEANRSHLHLSISELNPESMGGLILFFESLTVMVGLHLEIDPFDQPGVEAGKKFAHEWLSKHQ
jgi:glucose-6-phosphate isomerase